MAAGILSKELFLPRIIQNFYTDNTFVNKSDNFSEVVKEGKYVHFPIAGLPPGILRNNNTFPLGINTPPNPLIANATTRADIDLFVTLNDYTTLPIQIKQTEKFQLSYDKQGSIILEAYLALGQLACNDILQNWVANQLINNVSTPLPASQIGRTTGPLTPVYPGFGLTGTRRLPLLTDFAMVQGIFDNANIPRSGRYLILDPFFEIAIKTIQELTNILWIDKAVIKDGIVEQICGFTVVPSRSYVPSYNNAYVLNPVPNPPAAHAVNDNLACVFWHEDSVAHALGEVDLFTSIQDPLFTGDVYSGLLLAAGARKRDSGVFVLQQG